MYEPSSAPPSSHARSGNRHGPLAWFARNPVAANLLFFLLIVIGAISLLQTKLEVFPEATPRIVTVSVPYPGANPEEVEQGVLLRVEEAVADVEGVKKVRGIAAENQGVVTVEAHNYVDMDEFYEDVKSAVDQLTTLPEQADEPTVSDAGDMVQVITLALFGDVDRSTLREQAERIKDELQQSGGVSQVSISGLPDYEISVELDERTLRRYGLTFGDVAQAIRRSSLDLPAGEVKGGGTQVLVRSVNQAYYGRDFEDVVVRRDDEGSTITVGDLGRVIDGFEDTDFEVTFNGKPAAIMEVYRVGNEGALNVTATVKSYLATQEQRLPAGLQLASYNDSGDALMSRIELMLRNAGIGLVLVILILGLFLDLRLAFWCAAGLVMSVVASITVLPYYDVSINMISLFAFILVLGILVDDAIVVGENIYAHREMGKSMVVASIDGTREVAIPVTVTILTSIVAFAPLLFASGTIGEILAVIPIVVIAVLVLSLVEALLILPAHLSMGESWEPRWYHKLRGAAGRSLDWFADRPYRRLLGTAVRWRYVTIATAIALVAVTLGYVVGGLLPWRFFPAVEADIITATIEMPPGTSINRTQEAIDQIYSAAEQLRDEFDGERPEQDARLIRHIQVAAGGTPFTDIRGGPGAMPAMASRDPRLGEVMIELQKGEERDISATVIADRWRELVGQVPGAQALEFTSELISAGDAVNVELRSRDTASLVAAADWLQSQVRRIEGTREVKDDFEGGKPEVQITGITPLGRALGLTPEDIFRQVRGAFFGEEAQRIQRGRDEVRVYVRYPAGQRQGIADVENLYIRLPDGTEAPLTRVAHYQLGEGFSSINRVDRRRVVAVTADVDPSVATASNVNEVLAENVLPELRAQFPVVSWTMEGEQQEQLESMESLRLGMLVALVGIFGLLAIQFRSYVQPLVVMSAIPFGITGAIWGHIVMDTFVRPTPLSFISMFGVVALTGVVVNDSLILLDLINRKRIAARASVERWDVLTGIVVESGIRRFRPIFLTTITTFFGLMPIIVETSLQAQFIIPMAVSLGFGVLFATTITLLLVPSIYLVVEDLRRLFLPLLGDKVRYITDETIDNFDASLPASV